MNEGSTGGGTTMSGPLQAMEAALAARPLPEAMSLRQRES